MGMSGKQVVTAGALGLWVATVAVGCGASDGTCASIGGVYQPLYVARAGGTCGPLNDANNVPIHNDIQIQKFANVDVETETIVMGCSLNLTQIVRDKMGVPQKHIYGNSLDVENSNKVAGMVTLTRYDAAGQPVCAGEYDAVLEKSTTTLGGAASAK